PNSTDGTFTHEQRTLRGLLRSCLFIERDTHAPFFLLFFSGARWQVGDQLFATVVRAAEKQKGGSWGGASFYKQATRNRVGRRIQHLPAIQTDQPPIASD